MKTRTLIRRAGSMEKLARLYVPPITRQAVSAWGENVPIRRENELRGLRPDLFVKAKTSLFDADPKDPNKLAWPVVLNSRTGHFRKATPAEARKYNKEENKMRVFRSAAK